jgi:putative protease
MSACQEQTTTNRRTPEAQVELLAPAGDWDCLRAAVENGADAVYFGLERGFNARARAHNFTVEELPEVVTFLHRRGVKGYVTFNTLVFSAELPEAEDLIRQIAAAGADAVLVQDLGVVRLIREVCSDLAIHASTQMTLTSGECIRAAEMLGIERVVLARELSVREIAQIHDQTAIPLEVFVHGALCVAYSGQCLTSESLGGRSANRGQCAQACRLPYEVICDGKDVELGQVQYVLSPQDLAAYALVPDLLVAGVRAFKIEGRLKSAEYVANITRSYRAAIDTALTGRPVSFSDDEVREMELSFSRGFSVGWLGGCDHKMLVPGTSSAKRGVLLGEVEAVRAGRVAIRLASPVSRGDGVAFEGDRARGEEQGGRVFAVHQNGRSIDRSIATGVVELAFGRDSVDLRRVRPGQRVFKTDDPQLTQRLRKTFTGRDALRRVPLDLAVAAGVGDRLTVRGRAASGATCLVRSEEPLAEAIKHPLTLDLLRSQLGRLGGSVFELRDLDADIKGSPMVPLSVLGQVRREMVRQLDASIASPRPRHIAEVGALARLQQSIAENDAVGNALRGVPRSPRDGASPMEHDRDGATHKEGHRDRAASLERYRGRSVPMIGVLCRSLDQLEAALDCGVIEVFADFQDIREYRRAVDVAHAHGAAIYLATPRIQKPDELGIFRAMLRHGADGILARNLAAIRFCNEHEVPFVADYSLNAANELTVAYLRELGARRVTASYDLNRQQLVDLVRATRPGWLEVVIHQHMPMFHMEHCVFCAVLSPGTNKHDCGRPCDVHEVKLRDRTGSEHRLVADVGCRNTLYNAVPQSSAEVVPLLMELGIRHIRIELLDEGPEQIARTIRLYRELLAGDVTGKAVWKKLQAANRVGVTRGTLEERRNPLAIL